MGGGDRRSQAALLTGCPRLRDQHRREYPPGSAVEIPFGTDEQVAYSWSAGIAGPRAHR